MTIDDVAHEYGMRGPELIELLVSHGYTKFAAASDTVDEVPRLQIGAILELIGIEPPPSDHEE